ENLSGPAGPRWRQLINRTPAVCTAGTGGAIQATGLVEDHAGPRSLSVATLTEGVNNALRPAASASQFVHGAEALVATAPAAEERRAVESSCPVEDEIGTARGIPIAASVEAVKHRLSPRAKCASVCGCGQLENRSAANAAAARPPSLRSCTVEVAVGPDDQPGIGIPPVAASHEVIERSEHPVRASVN